MCSMNIYVMWCWCISIPTLWNKKMNRIQKMSSLYLHEIYFRYLDPYFCSFLLLYLQSRFIKSCWHHKCSEFLFWSFLNSLDFQFNWNESQTTATKVVLYKGQGRLFSLAKFDVKICLILYLNRWKQAIHFKDRPQKFWVTLDEDWSYIACL